MYKHYRNGKRVIAFTRTASDDQSGKQHQKQLEAIRTVAMANGLELVGEVSITSTDGNDLLRAVLNRHAEIPFDAIVVSAVDRLSRDFFTACGLFISLKFEGIAVVAADCNI